ncbi:hypothetical protein O181_002498, partial [Austropuccinia psidii MF-1]|nr:hypothetical protein [Austropuccinia psidii MF-1]
MHEIPNLFHGLSFDYPNGKTAEASLALLFSLDYRIASDLASKEISNQVNPSIGKDEAHELFALKIQMAIDDIRFINSQKPHSAPSLFLNDNQKLSYPDLDALKFNNPSNMSSSNNSYIKPIHTQKITSSPSLNKNPIINGNQFIDYPDLQYLTLSETPNTKLVKTEAKNPTSATSRLALRLQAVCSRLESSISLHQDSNYPPDFSTKLVLNNSIPKIDGQFESYSNSDHTSASTSDESLTPEEYLTPSEEISEFELDEPTLPQQIVLEIHQLANSKEFLHQSLNLDGIHSLRILQRRIPNAFGVQWEITRLAWDSLLLESCPKLIKNDKIPRLELADLPTSFHDSLRPHLDLLSFSREKIGLDVNERVWKELDLEFLSDLEGKDRALGCADQTDLPDLLIKSTLGDGFAEWYGGKVKFSGVILSINDQKTKFTIRLNPPKLDRSCMFKRKFGSHSFVELTAEDSLMNSNDSLKSLFHFILKPFQCLGRTWTIFDYEDNRFQYFSPGLPQSALQTKLNHFNPQSKTLPINNHKYHSELSSFEKFVNWYCPLEENSHLQIAKLARRFKLGRSITIPALKFDPSNILRGDERYGVEDILSNTASDKNATEACMTDGNGWMNQCAFQLLREKFHELRLNTTIQARICGAKGTWTLGPKDWPEHQINQPRIIIRDSQVKVRYGSDLSPWNCILNVVTLSRVIYPASLSSQIIEHLSDRGVPYTPIYNLMESALQTTFDELSDWDRHPAESQEQQRRRLYYTYEKLGAMIARRRRELEDQARVFVSTFESPTSSNSNEGEFQGSELSNPNNSIGTCSYSGLPFSNNEKILALLRTGFLPLDCPYLAHKMISIIKLQLKLQIKKFHIICSQSASAMIIPDPENILKENQIALCFSEPPLDELGIPLEFIEGEVLLFRHPCLLPTDIRKVTAVHYRLLDRYRDVILLPTVGNQSLASILGGGDVDGDRALIIWNKEIVFNFTNANLKFIKPPFNQLDLFNSETIKVSEFNKECDKMKLNHDEMIKTLKTMMLKPILNKSYHAIYSTWHVKSCYKNGTEHSDSIRLAHLVMVLLDSAKSGLTLKLENFKVDNKIWNNFQMPNYHQWIKDFNEFNNENEVNYNYYQDERINKINLTKNPNYSNFHYLDKLISDF